MELPQLQHQKTEPIEVQKRANRQKIARALVAAVEICGSLEELVREEGEPISPPQPKEEPKFSGALSSSP